MIKVVTFKKYEGLARINTFISYNFYFDIINKELIGSPEGKTGIETHIICVGVSHKLMMCWQIKENDLLKVMFENGKRKIIQDLKNGTMGEYQELMLTTENTEDKLIFDPIKINIQTGLRFEVEIPNSKLSADTGELELAEKIIKTICNVLNYCIINY